MTDRDVLTLMLAKAEINIDRRGVSFFDIHENDGWSGVSFTFNDDGSLRSVVSWGS